ncbi:MAG: response regulator [Burkholderiales bacterium]|nr:response regulator [Burkholderiales bacterium]
MAALLKKVLVVDDDPVVAKSFGRVLAAKGYAVVTAENGEQALAKLMREDYDLVYADIRMPGMDGIEVAEKVKAWRPWIPVVIVTGYGTSENEARARNIGVSGFLNKPLSPAMIEASARQALAGTAAGIAAAIGAPAAIPAAARVEAVPVVEARPQEAATAPAAPVSALRNLALFLAAPFIGLAYMLAFPVVGMGMLVWTATGNWRKKASVRRVGAVLRHAGVLVAAPFIALACVIAFPFVGLGMLIYVGLQALRPGENRGE